MSINPGAVLLALVVAGLLLSVGYLIVIDSKVELKKCEDYAKAHNTTCTVLDGHRVITTLNVSV